MIDEQVQSLKSVAKLLELSDESIRIVDVGSNSVEGSPPYHALMQAGLCLVIGFEPQADTVANSQHETHLRLAMGERSIFTSVPTQVGVQRSNQIRAQSTFSRNMPPMPKSSARPGLRLVA